MTSTTTTKTSNPPLPSYLHLRPATPSDAQSLSRLWFTSFLPSHAFWRVNFPQNPRSEAWWTEAWRLSIEEDPTSRTFVVEDTRTEEEEGGKKKLVGFSRWLAPREDGKIVGSPWPDMLEEWDMEVLGAFFGGMAVNREALMGERPHWFLELLGTDPKYQRLGVGVALLKWGSELADEQGLECYLDASEKGAPFYVKHFGFAPERLVPLPEKPETYGKFTYVSHVRPKQSS